MTGRLLVWDSPYQQGAKASRNKNSEYPQYSIKCSSSLLIWFALWFAHPINFQSFFLNGRAPKVFDHVWQNLEMLWLFLVAKDRSPKVQGKCALPLDSIFHERFQALVLTDL